MWNNLLGFMLVIYRINAFELHLFAIVAAGAVFLTLKAGQHYHEA
jgi:hypothetical protein